MKKVIAIIVGFMMLMMIPGISMGSDEGPDKAKKAKVAKVKQEKGINGPYVELQGGAAFLTDSDVNPSVDTDTGYALGVAAGYKFGKVRAEAEVGYQKNEVDSCSINSSRCRNATGDIKAYTFLVNGYYDFINKTRFTPYLTAGIGVAKVDADVNRIAHVDDVDFAYQVGAGVAYAINKNISIDLKYRYLDTVEDIGFENTDPEFSTHNVFLALKYFF
jgi:opacity protein-like surface antigen